MFFDEDALEYDDPAHSTDEKRFLLLGRSFTLRILVVCHCLRESSSVIRIISARKAKANERHTYAQGGKI